MVMITEIATLMLIVVSVAVIVLMISMLALPLRVKMSQAWFVWLANRTALSLDLELLGNGWCLLNSKWKVGVKTTGSLIGATTRAQRESLFRSMGHDQSKNAKPLESRPPDKNNAPKSLVQKL